MDDKLPELLPCPFCGSDDVIAMPTGEDIIFHVYGYMVTCIKCGGNLTLYKEDTDDFREEVKKAWNRRAGSAYTIGGKRHDVTDEQSLVDAKQ